MFVRPVTRRAGTALRNAPSVPRRSIQMPASESAALKGTTPSAPGAKVGGGQNSLLVGTALLGATLAAGYVYGTAGNTNKKALGSLNAAAEKASKQVPKKVTQKAQEAKEATISATKQVASSEPKPSSPKAASPPGPAVSSTGATEPLPSVSDSDDAVSVSSSLSDPGSLSSEEEDEDPAQAAFNPETGEINWDCPCLGGMAHGVCGEQFKEAFSCFIYSTAEPKGQDCIEKFRGMQECFAAHPEVYGEVMGDDDEDEFEVLPSPSGDDDIVSAVEKALGGR